VKYRAVIFDLFGTLVDHYGSTGEYRTSLDAVAEALSVPAHDFVRLWGETYNQRSTGQIASIEDNLEQICRDMGAPVEPLRIAEATRIRLDFIRGGLTPRPDAVETLERLRAAGLKIGLISNCSVDVPAMWPETPFAPLVEAPVFSATAGLMKPDPRIYRLACDRLGVAPGDCLYVADGEGGELEAAATAGMEAALIRVPYEERADLTRLDPQTWRGPRVTAVAEVLALVSE
jgi:putative hydrolase of the HAD superfamily